MSILTFKTAIDTCKFILILDLFFNHNIFQRNSDQSQCPFLVYASLKFYAHTWRYLKKTTIKHIKKCSYLSLICGFQLAQMIKSLMVE